MPLTWALPCGYNTGVNERGDLMTVSNATVYDQLMQCLKVTDRRVMNFTNGELMVAKLELLRLVQTINTEEGLRAMCDS